jgi:hypothetical protein
MKSVWPFTSTARKRLERISAATDSSCSRAAGVKSLESKSNRTASHRTCSRWYTCHGGSVTPSAMVLFRQLQSSGWSTGVILMPSRYTYAHALDSLGASRRSSTFSSSGGRKLPMVTYASPPRAGNTSLSLVQLQRSLSRFRSGFSTWATTSKRPSPTSRNGDALK